MLNQYLPAYLALVFLLIQACASNDLDEMSTVTCDGQTASFVNHIQPIVAANCAISGCHNGDLGEDRNWTIPQNLKDNAAEARRRVLLPLSHADHMPQGATLADADLNRIICWVDQGAPIDN